MTLMRVQKNKENPYVILNKKFLEDPNISLKLKGFIAYCMSKPDDWLFHIEQLASVLKEGKDCIQAIVREGIEHGYIEKNVIKVKGRFASVDYIIHEEKIKESFTERAFPALVSPALENPSLLSNDPKLCIDKKNNPPPPKRGPEPNAGAKALCEFFLEKIKEEKPNFTGVITNSWIKAAQALLKKRRVEEIKKVIEFALHQNFCKTYVISVPKLLEHLDSLELKMLNHLSTPSVGGNFSWAQKVKKIVDEANAHWISVGNEGVCFSSGHSPLMIKYNEHGFQEQVKNRLRLEKISTQGL